MRAVEPVLLISLLITLVCLILVIPILMTRGRDRD